MTQDVLKESNRRDRLQDRDLQALTQPIYPYGSFHLDMSTRIPLCQEHMTLAA